MRATVLLRLAFSGSLTDRVRAGLTVVAAAVAGLAILALGTVLNMAPTEQMIVLPDGQVVEAQTNWRYTTMLLNDMGLRPGLIAMVAAAVIPPLVLIMQSARLGGPARDHRLATMRLAGATPRQIRALAATEQGFGVGLGGLIAMAVFPLLHQLLHRPTMSGVRAGAVFDLRFYVDLRPHAGPLLPLPTDTWPAWWSWVVVALGLPVLASLLSALALRELIKSPVAAARRARRGKPRLWPVWTLVAGLAGVAACRVWVDRLAHAEQTTPELVAAYLAMVGCLAAICLAVPLCAAGVGHLLALLALRFGRGASTLIAARRVHAEPYAGSRAVSGLLVCAVITAVLVSIRTYYDFVNVVASRHGGRFGDPELTDLVMDLLDGLALTFVLFAVVGLLIAFVDAAMTRRQTEAALLASGTALPVLIRAKVIVVLLTAVPGVLLGLVTGFAAPILALPPAEAPASISLICHKLGDADTIVPCTPEGVARQRNADMRNGRPAYSYIEYQTSGPWHAVYPAVPWGRLGWIGGLALAAVALATALSLLVGRRSSLATALRAT